MDSVSHWNGASWSELRTGSVWAAGILWANGPNDIWASNRRHWDGTRWSAWPADETLAPPLVAPWIRGLWGTGPTDMWVHAEAGRGDAGPSDDAVLYHWDGVAWSKRASWLPEYYTLEITDGSRHVTYVSTVVERSLRGAGANNLWVIKSADRLARWNGTLLEDMPVPPLRVRTLWVGSERDVWAGGESLDIADPAGRFAHFDGTVWSTSTFRTTPFHAPLGLWGTSADLWAVGWRGMSSHWDGTQWCQAEDFDPEGDPDPDYRRSSSISGTGALDIWTPGFKGLFHYGPR